MRWLTPGWKKKSNKNQRRSCWPRGGTRALERLTLHAPCHRALRLIVLRRYQLGNMYPSMNLLRCCILFRTQRCTFFIRASFSLTVMAVTSQMTSRLTQICDRQSVLHNVIGHGVQVISKLPGPNKYENMEMEDVEVTTEPVMASFKIRVCPAGRSFSYQLHEVLIGEFLETAQLPKLAPEQPSKPQEMAFDPCGRVSMCHFILVAEYKHDFAGVCQSCHARP